MSEGPPGDSSFSTGGEGADHEAGDVGEDGGAARRDSVLGEEEIEGKQGGVDFLGREQVVVGRENLVEAVAVVAILLDDVVGGAEAGVRVLRGQAAAASGGGAVVAADGIADGAGRGGIVRILRCARNGVHWFCPL